MDYWDGKSEEVYGAVLPPFRKQIFLTTRPTTATGAGPKRNWNLAEASHHDYLPMAAPPGRRKWTKSERFSLPAAPSRRSRRTKGRKMPLYGFTGRRDPHVHLAMLKHYDEYKLPILIAVHAATPAT